MSITALQAQWRQRFGVQGSCGPSVSFNVTPSTFPVQNVTMQYGTTSYQCNAATFITTTVTAANTRTIDLTALLAPDGSALALTKVKSIQACVTTTAVTDTDPVYRIGPGGIANGAILGFGSTTGQNDVRIGGYEQFNPVSGWAVTASNKVLLLTNPGAYNVTASVFITGTT